jgi:hypothetical protein
MAGTIIVDRIESDASYASSINVAAQVTFSNTVSFSSTANVTGNMTVTGKLGIGTTSPAYKLDVVGDINVPSDSSYTLGAGADRYIKHRSSNGDILYSFSAGNFYQQNITTSYHAWFTGNNERMRIDSSGAVLANTTTRNSSGVVEIKTTIGTDNALVLKTAESGAGGTATMMQTRYNATTVGSITSTSSATAYNTSSDYRLKEDIAPMVGALAKVAQLKPVTYKWKSDGSDGEGFIAHELAEVCPHAVTGAKDAVDADGKPIHQGIDVSFLVATLTAAIQELKAEFDAYKSTHP